MTTNTDSNIADYECSACYRPESTHTQAETEACAKWLNDSAEAEIRAEFGMSWVHGGGRAEDVNAAYYTHRIAAR